MKNTGKDIKRHNLSSNYNTEKFLEEVGRRKLARLPVIVEFVDATRSLDQNSMIYALYSQLGAQIEDQSIVDIRRECKLRFGVPIMCSGESKLCDAFRKIIDSMKAFADWEDMLLAMDILPVTSKMNKTQATEYIEIIIREYSNQGYSLLHPEEEKAYNDAT